MALQSSGSISLKNIADEFDVSYSNLSLETFSNLAGFSDPNAISEFYGYSSVNSFTWSGSVRSTNSSSVCFNSVNQAYYHNNGSGGSSTFIAVNDYVYSDSGLNNKLAGGYYKVNHPSFDWVRVNGFGRIFTTGFCL